MNESVNEMITKVFIEHPGYTGSVKDSLCDDVLVLVGEVQGGGLVMPHLNKDNVKDTKENKKKEMKENKGKEEKTEKTEKKEKKEKKEN